jgi:hypothetical protein
MFQMLGVFAEFKRSMIKERVRAGLARAKETGIKLGPPFTAPGQGRRHTSGLSQPGRPGVRKIAAQFEEVARDRVLLHQELAQVIVAAREIGGPYGAIVEFLALTGQRREEVTPMKSDELDMAQRVSTLPKSRTKNGKEHLAHLTASGWRGCGSGSA